MLYEKKKYHDLIAYLIYSTGKNKINTTSVMTCLKLSYSVLNSDIFLQVGYLSHFSSLGKMDEGGGGGSGELKLHF